VAACCVASLSVTLTLWVGTVWLPAALSSPPEPRGNAAVTSAASVPGQTAGANPTYARKPDGRFIHPLTGQPCPIGTKPTGRSGCVGYCPEQDKFYWEETGQCSATSRQSVIMRSSDMRPRPSRQSSSEPTIAIFKQGENLRNSLFNLILN
jgi:hypothetical protein